MRESEEFAHVLHSGKKIQTPFFRLHYCDDEKPRIGFIISKRNIPHAYRRNRIKRQLRHILRTFIANDMINHTSLVIRVFRQAQDATYTDLYKACDEALRRIHKNAPSHHLSK